MGYLFQKKLRSKPYFSNSSIAKQFIRFMESLSKTNSCFKGFIASLYAEILT